MENVVTIQQFKGQVVGSNDPNNVKAWPMDEVRCNGRRIAFVDHKEDATVRFTRVLSAPTKKDIRDKVAALRKSLGGPSVAELTASPPQPGHMEKYLQALASQNGTTHDEESDE